jgi:hypothetical protein
MAMIGVSAAAQTDQKEYKTFVKNDHHVFYCTHEGVTVVVDPTQGGIFEPHITIINDSGQEFLFEPKKIVATAYGIPGNTYKKTRYRVERFLEKGDTLGFEKDVLKIYTPEKYIKEENKASWWASFIGNAVRTAVVVGVDALADKDRTPEERAVNRLIERQESERFHQKMEDEHQQEVKRIEEHYWRANTIFNGEEHEGFIAIKPINSQYIMLDIPVNGENFHFIIDNKKRY